MIVCVCDGASDRQLASAILHGANSLGELQRQGIGTGCGACHDVLENRVRSGDRPGGPRPRRRAPVLNDVLTAELTAIHQYFVHSEMCENWGYERLHKTIRHHSIGEMKHAEELIERILFLEGVPNVQRLGKINIGETVPEILKLDLALEMDALPRLNSGIELCTSVGDNNSRHLLEEILEDEEEHVDWLEAQVALVDQVGLQNYLAQQIRHDD
jgi:bacterioferritin